MRPATLSSVEKLAAKAGVRPGLQISAADKNKKCIELFDRFLAAWNFSGNTRKTYVNFATRFSDFIGAKSLVEIAAQDVSEFRIHLFKQGFSPASQSAAFHALRKLYRVLRSANVISWSPPHTLPARKKSGKRLPKSLSEKNVKKLIAGASSLRNAALLEFLYATGCRPAEATKMRVEDMSLECQHCHNSRWKGRR